MSSIFTNEFYDHLYVLESRSTAADSWASFTPEDDPELQWCRNFIEEKLSIREEEWFNKKLHKCFENGLIGRNAMARSMGISEPTFKDYLEKYDLVREEQYLKYFWYGLIFKHSKNGKIIFCRDKKLAAKSLKIKFARSIDAAARGASSGRLLRGYYVYRMRQWKDIHPDFTLDREDVINNEVIKIAE